MNKHNVVEFHNYKTNKEQSRVEQGCFAVLDEAIGRISEMQTYVKNFHQYINNTVKYSYINEEFANNLRCQIDLVAETAMKAITERRAG